MEMETCSAGPRERFKWTRNFVRGGKDRWQRRNTGPVFLGYEKGPPASRKIVLRLVKGSQNGNAGVASSFF